jgi:hypothetical protein
MAGLTSTAGCPPLTTATATARRAQAGLPPTPAIQRRKKTAKERWEQKLRAEGRVVQTHLSAFAQLQEHRGGTPTKLGAAVYAALNLGVPDSSMSAPSRSDKKTGKGLPTAEPGSWERPVGAPAPSEAEASAPAVPMDVREVASPVVVGVPDSGMSAPRRSEVRDTGIAPGMGEARLAAAAGEDESTGN